MKWRMTKTAAMLALAGGLLLQNGCGSSGPNQVTITVSSPTVTVIANTTTTIEADVSGSDTTTSTWSCSYVYTPNPTTQNPSPSQVGPIDNCTSGETVAALGGGSLGTWSQEPNAASNVLTYNAPQLSNFPNPIPTITFTAAATANKSKKATAVVTLDTGIRTSLSPATATVPTEVTPAQQVQFTANFLNVSPANANPQWKLVQPVSGNTTDFPDGTTPEPQDVACTASSCGTISAQGVYTAPATQPTNTTPVGAGSQASTLAPIVYVVCWSAADINHFAVATITLVQASTNPITFTGIEPTTIAAGGVLQDVWLNAHNLLNTTQISFTPPGGQPQLIPNSTNVFTVPITTAYCKASATGVTPVVTCDASIMTRVRLTQSQLTTAGTGTITALIPNSSGSLSPVSYPINLVNVSPSLVGAAPDSYPQGTSTDYSADGGYFGTSGSPLVQLLFNGQYNTSVATSNPRTISGYLPAGNEALNGPGLYPVSVVSTTAPGAVPYPLVTTDVAVQPTFQSGSNSLNSIYFTPATSTTPQTQIAYPPNIAFPTVGGVSSGMPSSIALNSTKAYAAVTLQAANAVQIVNLVPNGSGRYMPQFGASIPVGNQPTSIAIDDQINLTNYPGQDLGVVVNSADYTLSLLALPSGANLGTVSLSGLISGGPTGTGAPTPYAVGVDPTTHYAVVAFSNSYVGFVVDVNPNTSSTPPTCFVTSQTPPCALASVSMNTGATPQVVMQPGVPVAYVTPGGSATGISGVTSVVNLLLTNNTVAVAASPNGITCTNDIVTVTTPTINGLNPSSPGSVLITGVTPSSYNGTYNVLSVPTSYTFTYQYSGTSCPSTTTGGGGIVTYGYPYYTFGISPTLVGAAINPISRMLAFANPGAASSAPQIGFISDLDQTVSSLYLSVGSCQSCSPSPSGAPEVGLRWVSWDPYRDVLVAFNPSNNYNQISLINPGGTGAGGAAIAPFRIIQAIATNQEGQGSFTPSGGSTAVTVYGPMVYDPMTNLVLTANAGSNTLTYLDIDPYTTFKPANIEGIIVTSGGVASSQPPLASAPNAPSPLPKAVCDPASPTNIYASCFPQAVTVGQSATLRILGQGFTAAGTPTVQLDSSSTGVTITNATNTEVDVTVAASRLTQAHDFALEVVGANGVGSNSMALHAVGVISLSSLCSSAVMPEAVAMDEIANVAVITNYGCNSISFINMDSTNAHNYGVPYGALLATVNVGNNPIGVDVIPRLGYAVVANNADASASIVQYGGSPFTATELAFTAVTCQTATTGVSTTNICTGVSPVGVAIDQDHAIALVANSGGSSLSAIDLTPLLWETSSGCQAPSTTGIGCVPPMQLVPTSGPPYQIAVDPNRAEAVVTNIQNAGTTSVTGGLDVINLSTSPPSKTTTASISSITANPTGIVYDPAATSSSCSTPCTSSALFYATSTQQNAIYSFDPDSGSTTLIRVGVNPYSIAYNYQSGALVTANSTANTLSLVDAVNAPTFVTRETLGISSQSQLALAIDNFTNTAIMVDQNNDRVLLIPIQVQ